MTTPTTPRYTSGQRRRLRRTSSTQSVTRRWIVEKSRKPRSTGFLSLYAYAPARITQDACVSCRDKSSAGCAYASGRSNARTSGGSMSESDGPSVACAVVCSIVALPHVVGQGSRTCFLAHDARRWLPAISQGVNAASTTLSFPTALSATLPAQRTDRRGLWCHPSSPGLKIWQPRSSHPVHWNWANEQNGHACMLERGGGDTTEHEPV